MKQYTKILTPFADKGKWKSVLEVIQEMRAEGLEPNEFTCTCVITALANNPEGGLADAAEEAFEQMRSTGIRPTTMSYTALITAMANAHGGKKWKDAERIFQEMVAEGIALDVQAFTALITAYEKAAGGSQWEKALRSFQQMRDAGIKPNDVAYTALITALAKALKGSQWKLALNFLREMQEAGLKPSILTYTGLIAAVGNAPEGSQWKLAINLFEKMESEGVRADAIAYSALFSALSKAKARGKELSQKAEKYFWKMDSEDILPDVRTCNSFLRVMKQAPKRDQWQKMERCYNMMTSEGPEPNAETYTLLLFSIGNAPDFTGPFAKRAVELLICARGKRGFANSKKHARLKHLLAKAGMKAEAEDLIE
uniref:Pentacotripeptide-repeat region of PRORP domain-containing protein n=1 Tax=Chromera velia CCMP2878 TaxID=1169474 RepID=A0A0G4FBH2_9ALVE|eukprot:Cvel_16140.t1-p1 / transcript=Cvel_16140.t1 / gene=Cvel_16140 / organism=Chromera_velia_CCMP2878 / gene_product=Pentatricopeptide repeat-containing protein, putative / transcript_product=Pentatricopeptide repeat-containing protein, putative / location=Cvel_scaffold1229:21338-22441(-) / protein_length=368 / sequence_SO=supercontig / SO=protein_coding / is_pseudo=false